MISKTVKALLLLCLTLASVQALTPTELKSGDFKNINLTLGGLQYFYHNVTSYKLGGSESVLSIETENRVAYTYAKIVDSATGEITDQMMPLVANETNYSPLPVFKGMQILYPLRVSSLQNFTCTSCYLLITVKYEEDLAAPAEIPLFMHLLDTSNVPSYKDDFNSEEIQTTKGKMELRRIVISNPAQTFNYFLGFQAKDGLIISMVSNGAHIPYNYEYFAGQSLGFRNYYFFEQADYKVKGGNEPTFTVLVFGDGNKFFLNGKIVNYDVNSDVPVLNEITQEERFKYHHFALRNPLINRTDEQVVLFTSKSYSGVEPTFYYKYSEASWDADFSKEFEGLNETESNKFTNQLHSLCKYLIVF